MTINDRFLSLPPYISTAWKNIVSLQVVPTRLSGPILALELTTGVRIEIPGLEREIVEQIFTAHATFLQNEAEVKRRTQEQTGQNPFQQLMSMPLPMIGGAEAIFQHDGAKSSAPPLPPELLEKISSIVGAMGDEIVASLPKPEPHCNCPHCQIMRAVQGEGAEVAPQEEAVTDEDLRFRTWDILKIADHLYRVTNPLDGKEQYNVFLGEPVGCTCGASKCEHIQAVLQT
jgi:hypothetical protein